MQRSYFLYFQLFLQALVFISHFASQAEASNDQRNLADVFRAIPPNVHCEEIIHTNSDGVSIQVCKSGTVRMLPWVTRALRLQRLVSYRRDICSVPIIGSHNSGISMAYGYGASDHLISRFSDVIGKFETSNQYFSVLDQLQLGVRLIEVDIHYFNNQIRVAHCGGFTSSTLDSLLNRVRKLPFVGKFVHSSGIIGCQPSFSGIPTKDQQPVENLLREIANWLQKSTTQFVFVYLDGDMQLLEEKKVNLLIKLIKDIFVDSEIFRPSDRANTETWPSTLELLQYGKRVMFLSRYDYSAQDDSYLFFKENVCNWTEPSLPLTDYPNCYFNKSQVFASSLYGTIDRVLSSEIQYGLFNSDGQFRQKENILDERNLLGVLKCGVNIPSPDNITPVRMQSMIWTMARENTWSPGSCLGLERNSEFWHQIDCQAIPANTAAACQSIKDARIWTISARAVLSLDDALEACAQTEAVATENSVVMAFSIPATAYENVVLMEAFKSSRFDRVIFNTNLLNM